MPNAYRRLENLFWQNGTASPACIYRRRATTSRQTGIGNITPSKNIWGRCTTSARTQVLPLLVVPEKSRQRAILSRTARARWTQPLVMSTLQKCCYTSSRFIFCFLVFHVQVRLKLLTNLFCTASCFALNASFSCFALNASFSWSTWTFLTSWFGCCPTHMKIECLKPFSRQRSHAGT